MKKDFMYISVAAVALAIAAPALGARVAHLPMDITGEASVRETVGGSTLTLFSKTKPENIAGAAGMALRFDGFSSYVQGEIAAGKADATEMTFSMWVAPETYPVIALDTPTEEKIRLAGTLDDSARAGWQFSLGYTGKYAFECYSGGWKVTVDASDLLPCYEWSRLTAVVDGGTKTATLYRNGVKVGESRCMATVDNSATTLTVGRNAEGVFSGPFMINTFNGLIDDVEVFDKAMTPAEIAALSPEHPADLSIPETRYAGQLMRPRFHGMPATAWTNECHGLTYSNGRYHLFFQKNANGPFMTRLHWGHISSPDLLHWREERIAIAPGEPYDVKGCWSGAVFTDEAVSGGKPAIIYTGVDYAKAAICLATPEDEDLIGWTKSGVNPIINGRPAGLSDDFRDPYFFRNGNDAYIIVGTSKAGMGAATLHKYDPSTGSFSNDGRIFFAATDAAQHGSFWEMPNITPLKDGKWLFTVTPLNTSRGVRCLYWIGSIAADGSFIPDGEARTLEMNSTDGYGLLSPTIYNHDGKTILLGIVPDKLPSENNYTLGWAHCYSLPRELSLADDGSLLQRPYSGAAGIRSEKERVTLENLSLNGVRKLDPVAGRRAELLATFEVGANPFGFRLFDNGSSAATLSYNPASGELVADFSAIERWENDRASYGGVYRMSFPVRPAAGSEMKVNLFIDGSIIDIFVNDRWAQSVRVFPLDDEANGISLYSEGEVRVRSLNAWNLAVGDSGVDGVTADSSADATVDVFHISGNLVRKAVARAGATAGLDPGIYVIDGKKFIVR